MTEVRTRDEALVAVDRGLAQWDTAATGVFVQAAAAASSAQLSAEAAVRRCTMKVAALEQLLRSLGPDDDRGPVERELAVARVSLQTARQGAQQIASVAQRLGALQRKQARSADALVRAARADLAKRTNELGSYRSGGVGEGGSSASGGSGAGVGVGSDWLNGTGLTEVDVASADFGGNPIIGSFGRGDTTRADYRWAVQTWDEVVRPGVARGMTRADFEARDAQRAAPALRRTASVHDLFLGDSDRLRLTRRPDGKLDVTNGRHRLEVARELGIRSLPGEVVDT